MLKVREYSIEPCPGAHSLWIPDGWIPLALFVAGNRVVLPALIDDARPSEEEKILVVEIKQNLSHERQELIPLGNVEVQGPEVMARLYLFLRVSPLPMLRDTTDGTVKMRRITHPTLLEFEEHPGRPGRT